MPKYATFDREVAPSPPPVAAAPHPLATASWISRWFLGWVTPLMQLGNEKQLDENDVWPLKREHQAAVITTTFGRAFEASRSVPRAFLRSFGWRFFLSGVAFFVATAMTFAGPVVLNHVVTELAAGEYDVQDLATWIFGLLVTQLVQALADNYANFEAEVIALELTATLKNLIYKKSLKLSAESRKLKSTGDITNLCKSDSEMILIAAIYIHQLWIMPLQVLAAGVMLYRLLGLASLAGFGIIGLTFVINHYLSVRFMDLYLEVMACKDERVKVVTEVFKSISIVKFNAWEDKFLERINASRSKELTTMWDLMVFIAVSVMMSWGLPVFISVTTFGVYGGVLHQQLTPSVVFTSIALFQLVQVPLRFITDIIASVVKAKVAEQRMTEFLALPELESGSVLSLNSPQADEYITKNVIVALDNATLAWAKEAPPLLRNTNLQIHTGEFVVVHGPVGCGKSSLCSALIGDMVKTQGLVYVGGSVAYCSQQPWIQHATVRDNILFGRPFDRKKYDKVVEACALTADLKSLPAGDRTEIGERGVNLSGGQKARVALARACYSDASVYILDAPLSAVDAIVQNEIFTKCLLGLLRHRTVILVTHNPEIIASEHVTRTITINVSGELVETRLTQGGRPSYDPLVAPFPHRAYVKTFEELKGSEENVPYGDDTLEFMEVTEMALGHKSPFRQRAHSANYGDDDEDHGVARDTATTEESHRLVDDEDRQQGRVGFHVFTAYYRAVGGFPVLFLILMSQVFWQGLQIGSDFWLTDWTSDAKSTAGDQPDHEAISTSYRIEVYTLLGLTSALMVLVRTVTVSYFGLRAAKEMFNNMTHALVHAPMKFFDANPIGRILMRYSNDVFNVDFDVPLTFGGFFANFFSAGCTLAVATAIIQWKGVFLLPVMYVYVRIGSFYLQPAREVERVLRTTEAPILSHLSESIEGGAVIRAFGLQQVSRFQSTNNSKLDVANKVWYARLAISRWFGLRIQLLSSLLIFIVAYSLVLLHNELSAAIIGLAFSYVLKVSVSMERIIQAWSSVETTMVSPERMQQYAEVEQEAPHKLPTADPPASAAWPANGAIDFENVGFRYKDGDRCVLNNLTLSIVGGEKIGIVGRTGAGKSSLTMALFRINELAAGTISIDGVDVGKIGLKTLRDNMSIIPQNPVLFKGPLRKYLDPFDEYADDQLWDSIRRVGLNERISSEDAKLDCTVEENGENFSVGERQMLCMARALLRDSRIVIFDEATAAIDHETDKKLQRVIREAFDKSTVLTIAHRLDTILDSDRILVLDGGEVVEFASPAELVKKGKGHFFDLMQEGGYLDKFLASS